MKIIFTILFIHLHILINAQSFYNATAEQNIIHSLNSTDLYGSGVSFFDFDNDGWDDLTLTQENDSILFFKNNLGYLQQLPSFLYGEGEVKQVLWVDYDNDDDYDLFMSIKNGTTKLFQNNGSFSFTDVTEIAGIATPIASNYGVSFGDYNNDSFLDFYVSRYYLDNIAIEPELNKNILFKNNGNGTFQNVTDYAGVSNGNKPTFPAVFLDYDRDGLSDIYVINDRAGFGNAMYKNNGDDTFTDVAPINGSEVFGQNPMSATVGDINNDGYLEIFMSNTGGLEAPGMMLINNSDGTFTESAAQMGLSNADFPNSWGADIMDIENDGDLDLIVATPDSTRDFFFRNSDNYFFDDPFVFPENYAANSFSVAKGDVNNDGYSDLIIENSNGDYSVFWKNIGGSRNHIKITLKGTISNKMAVGSFINVYAQGQRFVKYILCGENYLSQNSQHQIFGLGEVSIVDSIIVEYPSGIVEKYFNLEVNQHYYFTEGETISTTINTIGNTSFCLGDSAVLDAGEYVSYLWNTGYQDRYLTVFESGNYFVDVSNQMGVQLTSDTISINVSSVPNISYNLQNPLCYAEGNGSIQLVLEGEPDIFNVYWSNGFSGVNIDSLMQGNYTYYYSDEFGCTSVGSVDLFEPYEMVVLSKIINATNTEDGSVYLYINGGTPPYEIFFNGNIVQDFVDDIPVGIHQFDIYDSNGCYYVFPFEITNQPTQVNEPANENTTPKIYPNPILENNVFIESVNKIIDAKIYDSSGREIKSTLLNNKFIFEESSSKFYILKLISNKSIFNYKLIKK